jgi:hypothetical protein
MGLVGNDVTARRRRPAKPLPPARSLSGRVSRIGRGLWIRRPGDHLRSTSLRVSA